MKLPFLEESHWPISKEPAEQVANPSYETKIEDHLIDELMSAMEGKNPSKLRETLVALIQHIQSSEE